MKLALPSSDASGAFQQRTGHAPAPQTNSSQMGNLADVIRDSTFVWTQAEVALPIGQHADVPDAFFTSRARR
jgi:hypothetical protein